MKKIAKLLKADLNGTSDLASIAAMLTSKGRGNDTLLAHITPREAEILKAAGGSGTTNPDTGLLEFYDDFEAMPSSQAEFAQAQQAAQPSPVYQGDVVGTELPPLAAETAPQIRSLAGAIEPVVAQPVEAFQPTQAQRLFGADAYGAGAGAAPGRAYSADIREAYDQGLRAAPSETVPPPQEKSFFDKLSTPDMVRLGLAGAGSLIGAGTARKAAEAGKAGKAELQTLATPYQQTGAQVQAQAQRGELTPAGQQSLQAMQARLAQGAESRGGVGTAQAVAQLEALRQSLLQQQMDYGLKISGIGDNIAMGAIRTGLQADQAVNQLTNSMYSNMLYLASGMYPGVSRAQTTVGT